MTWITKELLPPLHEDVVQVIEDLQVTLSSIQPLVDALIVLLDAAKIFLSASQDLFATIMSLLIKTLEDLINDLFGAGLFQLMISPFHVEPKSRREEAVKDRFGITLITPNDAVKLAIKSLDDPGDIEGRGTLTPALKRPNFSDNALVSGFAILITAKDLSLLAEAIELLSKIWDIKEIKTIIKQINKKGFKVGENEPLSVDVTINNSGPFFDIGGRARRWALNSKTGVGYLLWYKVTDGAFLQDDPNHSTRFGIRVDISIADTADDIAEATAKAIDNVNDGELGASSNAPNILNITGSSVIIDPKDIDANVTIVTTAPPPDFPESTGPDWQSKRVNQIGSLLLVQNQLLKMLALAKGYTLVPEGVFKLIDALQKKLDQISDLIDVFQAILDDIRNIQGLADVFILDIPKGVGGNNRIKQLLPNPVFESEEFERNRYTVMIMYVGGGPTVEGAETLRQLVV